MARGPKPIPANLRVVKLGQTAAKKKDKENPEEPKLPVTIPDPPEHLEPEEADCFTNTAAKLAKMRVMSDADVDALAIYAVNHIRWRDATSKVREMGMIVKSPKGYPIQNPYLSIANRSQETCLKVLSEFGLTPSSRTRVKAQ